MAADPRRGCINSVDLRMAWSCLPWDTAIFGFPVLQICEIDVLGDNAAEKFADFERARDEVGCNFSSCRIGASQIRESMLLEARGFRFIETVYAPELSLKGPNGTSPDAGLRVSIAADWEFERAADIAAVAFVNERFHVDPRIPAGYGSRRYRNWVLSVDGHERQQLFVVREGPKLIAFFVTEDLPDGTCYWHLNAVSPEFQGQGYGLRAWSAMIENARSGGALRVRSSIVSRNCRVLNLYARLGFRFSEPSTTFHWLREAS